MTIRRLDIFVPALLVVFALTGPVAAENEGLTDLDEATQLKATAEGMDDLSRVIDLVDTAVEKGLDKENNEFAEQLLNSTLVQRAKAFSNAILTGAVPVSQQDNRWMQIRQFALTDLQRAVMLDNSQWEAHLLIGQLQLLGEANITGQSFAAGAARRSFTAVINSENVPDKELAEALALRGAVQRESDQRLEDFNRAVELQPDEAKFLLLRAKHHFGAENFDEALADVDRALELIPDAAGSYELRGKILLGQEKFDEATKSFDRAAELAPDSLVPYHRRGEVFIQQGELDKALEQLTKALEIKPDDAATLLIRGTVNYQAGNVEAALADIDQVLALKPGVVKAHELKADILASEERFDEAIAQLQKILVVAPDRPEMVSLQYRVANYYLFDQQPVPAIEAFDKVLKWDDDNADALRGRGDAYLNLGKHAEAIADFNAALETDPENDGLLNNLAWVLATSPMDDQRNGQRAIELATKACELTAYEMPHILSTLAAAYAETGEWETAIKYSEQAVEKGKDGLNADDLAAELASYKEHKPWREEHPLTVEGNSDQAPDDEPNAESQTSVPPATEPAPARTSDF